MNGIQNLLLEILESPSDEPKMTQEEFSKHKADAYNQTDGSLNAEDGYNCVACRNKGMTMTAKQLEGGLWVTTLKECKCVQIRKTIHNLNRSGLKNTIKNYTFDKYVVESDWQKRLKEAAEAYAYKPNGWFFLGGQSGIGKTHLCTAICRELLLDGKSVKYFLWRDDVAAIKGLITDGNQYSAAMDECKNVDVLYIDDMFKIGKKDTSVRPSVADINIAFEILNFRYNNPKLLTIISSECTIGEILTIDEAICGRIYERGNVYSIRPDKNKNYRLKGMQATT